MAQTSIITVIVFQIALGTQGEIILLGAAYIGRILSLLLLLLYVMLMIVVEKELVNIRVGLVERLTEYGVLERVPKLGRHQVVSIYMK